MISQIIANGIVRGAELGLLAFGITIIFKVLRFPNFAHGELALIGAYVAFFFSVTLSLPLALAAVLAVPVGGLVAVVCDRLVFQKIRYSPGLVLLIAAMGLSILLRHVVSLFWGVNALSYKESFVQSHRLLGAYVTTTHLIIIIASLVAMAGFHVLLSYSKLGKAMRAISDDKALAECRGIATEKVIMQVWFIIGSYAALGGILIALETLLAPEMGFNIMLPVFAAAILGGIGSIYGAILGALIIGLAENAIVSIDWSFLFSLFGLFELDGPVFLPTGYKFAISFVILIFTLIFMPRGIMKGDTGD